MADTDELLAAARQARERAHAPYSRYRVGAAVRGDSGRIFAGCNIENAAYPEGICAETAAIAQMILGGDRQIREVLVLAGGSELATPCGGCRQRLREFAAPDTPVHLATEDGQQRTETLDALLPLSFGPDHLP